MTEQKKKVPQALLPRGLAGRITVIFMNIGHKSIYKSVAKVLQLQQDDDLLEVACGNGYFLKKYASHVHSVAGLDLSELVVKMAKKKHRGRIKAGTAEFVHGDASQLPWEDSRFSVATSMGSFTSFPKPLESLKEIYRVLRPGGRVIVSIEWNAEDGLDHTKEVEDYGMRMWTEDDIRATLKEAGFSEISITYAKGLKMPKMMIARAVK
jgi:ubiquinone/menaquinone biosynthesis C-methylase UbiE